jgi:hypothetical protein
MLEPSVVVNDRKLRVDRPMYSHQYKICNCRTISLTFIKAFESLPVHCLKPRPSGKRRRQGKDGAAAMRLSISAIIFFALRAE